MGSPNTNYAARPAAAQSQSTVEVFSINDLPDPVGGVITLSSLRYVFKGGLTDIGTNTIAIPGGARTTLVSEDPWIDGLLYTGTSAFIQAAGADVISLERMNLATNNVAGATYFDISGCGLFNAENCIFEHFSTSAGSLGEIDTTAGVRMFTGQVSQIAGGITFKSCQSVLVNNFIFFMPTLTGAAINVTNPLLNTTTEIAIYQNQFNIDAAASKINIDPAATAFATINDNVGSGSFFVSGAEGIIANTTNKTVGPVSVTSVSQNGIYAQFEFGLGTTIQTGQIVVLSGFTNSEYNTTARVTSGGSAGSFVTEDIIWVGNDTGSFNAPAVEFNSPSHGQVDGTTVNVTKTIAYNGGYPIFDADTNNFSVGVAFDTGETSGTWNAGSLTEKAPNLTVFGNETQRDGGAQALGEVNNNNLGTTCTNGVYAALNLGTVTDSNITERFTLVDAGAGVYRYDGLETLDAEVFSTLTCIKTGGNFVTRFAVSINGVAPTFATAPYASITVQQTFERQVTVLEPIVIQNGDTVQIMAAGDSATSPIDIQDFRIFIR